MTKRCRRLVQVSDLHLVADPAARVHGYLTDESARAVLAAAFAGAPDLAVLSGDLADAGEPAAYERLLGWLADAPCPVALMPGNHDDRRALEAVGRRHGRTLGEKAALGPWRILCLDSSVAGQAGGRLGPVRLAAFRAALASIPDAAPTLVFVHHQPAPVEAPWIDAMGLADGEALLAELAARRGPTAAVCGHVHQAVTGWRRGVRWLTTPSTCSQARPFADRFEADGRHPGYRFFELRDDGAWETGVARLGG